MGQAHRKLGWAVQYPVSRATIHRIFCSGSCGMPLGCMVHIQTLTFLSLGGDRWNKTALGLVVSDVSMEDKKHEDFRQNKKKKKASA